MDWYIKLKSGAVSGSPQMFSNAPNGNWIKLKRLPAQVDNLRLRLDYAVDLDLGVAEEVLIERPKAEADLLVLSAVRLERNRRLQECDWTQLQDAPIPPTKASEWAVYRQALRDIPSAFISGQEAADIEWPIPPS